MWLKVVLMCIFGCTSSLTTSFDLSPVLSGNRMGAVPLGRSLGNGELDVEGICSQTGMACQDCHLAVTCVPLPVGWLKVPLQKCGENLTCNAHEGTCSNNTVPECDVTTQQFKHTCEQVGIFPDAYDCRKFHLCSPPEGLPDGRPADHRVALCPRNFGYNPQTAQCSIKLSHGQCREKPVPACKTIGQTEVLPTSPNHYFVCLLKKGALYPQIFICPHGWYFWDGFCRPEPKLPLEETTQKSTATTEQSAEKNKENSPSVETSTSESTMTYIESFFSTEKATTYAADSFLADKFDLANYESTDDAAPPADEFVNSFEDDSEFWQLFP